MKRVVQLLLRGHDYLTILGGAIAAIGLASIVGSYVYEVIARYIFSSPTAWASDYVSYALCATVFLALPQVTKNKAHVAVTIVVDVAPASIAGVVHVLVSLLGFFCLSLSAWVSLQENVRQYTRDIHTLAIVPIPQWWVSSFITFGLAVSAVYFIRYVSPKHRASESLEIG